MTAGQRGGYPLAGGRDAGKCVGCEATGSSLSRFRLRLGLITLMVSLAAIWGGGHLQGEQALATTPIQQVSAASIVQRVRQAHGHTLILALYRPDSDDPFTAADLRRWAVQTRTPPVEFVGAAVGTRRAAQVLVRYGMDAGVQRLSPEWLPAEEAAALDTLLAPLGIAPSDHQRLSLAVVFDRKGAVAGQWRGSLEYLPVLVAAKAARQR
jgi:hypothetical protein